MKEKLNFEARYPHPPARVWKALTDPEALAKWMMPNNFVPDLGHRFEFISDQGKEKFSCVVTELDPEKRLSFTWVGGDEDPPSVVRWTLQPDDGGGTRLTVEHQVLEPAASYVLIEAGMNWRSVMGDSLPVLLEAIAARSRPRAPIVYVEEPFETPSTRLAGLTRRDAPSEPQTDKEVVCQ